MFVFWRSFRFILINKLYFIDRKDYGEYEALRSQKIPGVINIIQFWTSKNDYLQKNPTCPSNCRFNCDFESIFFRFPMFHPWSIGVWQEREKSMSPWRYVCKVCTWRWKNASFTILSINSRFEASFCVKFRNFCLQIFRMYFIEFLDVPAHYIELEHFVMKAWCRVINQNVWTVDFALIKTWQIMCKKVFVVFNKFYQFYLEFQYFLKIRVKI